MNTLAQISTPPDESTLIQLHSISFIGTGLARAYQGPPLFGKERGGILHTETEEIICKVRKGDADEWWSCGTMHGLLSERMCCMQGLVESGRYSAIAWYKRG